MTRDEQLEDQYMQDYLRHEHLTMNIHHIEEDKGFEIKCLNCGSTDVSEEHDFDYDYDENMIDLGTYLICHNCGQCNR